MPQDGSNNYQYPAGTRGVTDQTIESEPYNTFLDDLVINDLNWPRPVHRGGTGASTAPAARTNLGVNVSSLTQVVTNYDSHTWESGSFTAEFNATAAPTADEGCSGICFILTGDSAFITLQVFGGYTGRVWTRHKVSNVWGPWLLRSGTQAESDARYDERYGTQAEHDARYVNTAGDTLTGGLSIHNTWPVILLDKLGPPGVDGSTIIGAENGIRRWEMHLGDNTPQTNFVLLRYNDAGVYSQVINISRATGAAQFLEQLYSNDAITASAGINGGVFLKADSANKYLAFDSNNHIVQDNQGTIHFKIYDFTRMFISGASGHFHVTQNALKPGGGLWADASDARIKTVLGDYTSGLDEIIAMHPVRYTFKGNDTITPPEHPSRMDKNKNTLPRSTEPLTAPYPNSPHSFVAAAGTEYAGLVAQEVETTSPDMVTQHAGYIDGQPVSDIRDLDTSALIFKLINAVKELAARVEQLEAT